MSEVVSVNRTLAAARALARKGDYCEAYRLCTSVLEKYPNNARAQQALRELRVPRLRKRGKAALDFKSRMNQVAALQNANRLGEALNAAAALVFAFPDEVQAHYLLGSVFLALRDPAAAVPCFERAIKLQPTFPEAYNNLGNALRFSGNRDEAIEKYSQAVDIDPEFVDGWNNLGAALREAADAHAALEMVDRALALAPNDFHTHMNRGHVLRDLGRYGDAIDELLAALGLRPDSVPVLIALGNTLRSAGRHDEALAVYRRTVAIDPAFAGGHASVGMALCDSGRLEEAEAAFREALRLQPASAEAHRNLSTVVTYRADDPELAAMHTLARSLLLDDDERMHLSFALGKAHDDIGDYDAAFDYFARANALHRGSRPYDAAAAESFAERVKRFFGDPVIRRLEPREDGPVPVFIVGMPRSGTTLVEQILASHPAVAAAGETNAFMRATHPFVEDLRSSTGSTVREATLAGIRAGYRGGMAEYGFTAPVVVDKMLANFRVAGVICSVFPEARIIDVRRDPVATSWSIYRQYFASLGNDFAYDFTDIIHQYGYYLDLVDFYKGRFSDQIVTIDYDALVADQETETRRLIAACGLDWNESCLNFHTTERAVTTTSGAQVRRPLYGGSSAAWRSYAGHVQPLLDGLGAAGLIG